MPKKCAHEGCKCPVFGGGYCKMHQGHRTDKKPKKIKQVSTKQTERLKEYRVVRDKFMKENPICEAPGCDRPSTDLHHQRGRVGNLLSDVRYFKALCRECHSYYETHPEIARQHGISMSRLESEG